jgi:hypothetical protein
MAITLPNASNADTDSQATNNANIVNAQNQFVAAVTVLINNAISNGLFFVQPVLPPLVTSEFVTSYFTNLGYTVTFPLLPSAPYNPAFIPGFPEVLPPGYQDWNGPYYNTTIQRIEIAWTGA